MSATRIGLLHPGAMGAAMGGVLRAAGHDVLWASEGRGEETAARAAAARLRDVGTAAEVARGAEVILSICPPHVTEEVLSSVRGFAGVYVDANAVAAATVRELAAAAEAAGASFVDGGIIGAPPRTEVEADGAAAAARDIYGAARLYLAGDAAGDVAALFRHTSVEVIALDGPVGSASALKMAYAAWSKGTQALLLASRALARAEGVEDTLMEEWARTYPDLAERCRRAAFRAEDKGWRWIAEMEEIAASMATVGLPDGFHLAAADLFARTPRRPSSSDDATVERVLDGLLAAQRAVGDPKLMRR